MIAVLTPEEMKAVDQAAPEPVEVLIERAGSAVAHAATRMLGGAYGKRVVVVAGKGNNGADGRAAARRLTARGVRVQLIEAADAPARLPSVDLVIDAAYGTGFRGTYEPPDAGGAPVLAVDVPSGNVISANRTVTFAALKPVLLLDGGPDHAGDIEVVDIGLDVSSARMHLVETSDVAAALPFRIAEILQGAGSGPKCGRFAKGGSGLGVVRRAICLGAILEESFGRGREAIQTQKEQ